jgi:hypothetical protein
MFHLKISVVLFGSLAITLSVHVSFQRVKEFGLWFGFASSFILMRMPSDVVFDHEFKSPPKKEMNPEAVFTVRK